MEVAMQCRCASFRRGIDQSPRMHWGHTNEISCAIVAIYGIRGRSRTVVLEHGRDPNYCMFSRSMLSLQAPLR